MKTNDGFVTVFMQIFTKEVRETAVAYNLILKKIHQTHVTESFNGIVPLIQVSQKIFNRWLGTGAWL